MLIHQVLVCSSLVGCKSMWWSEKNSNAQLESVLVPCGVSHTALLELLAMLDSLRLRESITEKPTSWMS